MGTNNIPSDPPGYCPSPPPPPPPPAHQLFWELRDYGLAAVRKKHYVPPHYPLRISAHVYNAWDRAVPQCNRSFFCGKIYSAFFTEIFFSNFIFSCVIQLLNSTLVFTLPNIQI